MDNVKRDREGKELELSFQNDTVHIDRPEDFERSIFRDVYNQVFEILYRVMYETPCDNNMEEDGGCLIAFVGGRGSGKTSAMQSVLRVLKDDNKEDCAPWKKLMEKHEAGIPCSNRDENSRQFIVLDNIDASFLEKNEDVFEIVLAKMLKTFNDAVNKKSDEKGIEFKKRDLQQKMDEIFEGFRHLNKKIKEESYYGVSSAAALQHLAISFELKSQFCDLVSQYLTLLNGNCLGYGKRQGRQDYLVIAIDDLDMNIKNAFSILEQIYRYMMVPNVLILVAVKYEQLEVLCERHFLKMFAKVNKDMPDEQLQYATRTAREYLEKIIPIHYRVYMPLFDRPSFVDTGNIRIQEVTVKEALLRMIAQRVGIYFDGIGDKKHFMEPLSLRGINNYYHFLNRLKPLDSDCFEEHYSYNYEKFWTDVLNRFVWGTLDEEGRKKTEEWMRLEHEEKNSFICHCIREELPEPLGKEEGMPVSYGRMLAELFRYTRYGRERKNWGHTILIVYSLLLTNYVYRIGKEQSSGTGAGLGQELRQELRRLLGRNVIDEWGNRLLPSLQKVETVPGTDTKILIAGAIGRNRAASSDITLFSIKADRGRKSSVLELEDWIGLLRGSTKELTAGAMIAMSFEGMRDSAYSPEDNFKMEIKAVHSHDGKNLTLNFVLKEKSKTFQFNLFGFILKSFFYQDFLDYFEKLLIDAILDSLNIHGGRREEAGGRLKDAMHLDANQKKNKLSFHTRYEEWAACNVPAVLPFHHTDIFFHILQRIEERQRTLPNVISGEEVFPVIQGLFDSLEEELKRADQFYLKDNHPHNMQNTFSCCPYIESFRKPGYYLPDNFMDSFRNLIVSFVSRSKDVGYEILSSED